MLKIHESTTSTGALSPVFFLVEDGVASLVSATEKIALPPGALDAVMARYGKPLEPSSRLTDVAALDVGDGRRLRHVRHRALYDVIARDYLVYEVSGTEPACALAATVAGALDHLGRRAGAP